MKKRKAKRPILKISKEVYVVVETREVWRGTDSEKAHRVAADLKLQPKSKVIVLRRGEHAKTR